MCWTVPWKVRPGYGFIFAESGLPEARCAASLSGTATSTVTSDDVRKDAELRGTREELARLLVEPRRDDDPGDGSADLRARHAALGEPDLGVAVASLFARAWYMAAASPSARSRIRSLSAICFARGGLRELGPVSLVAERCEEVSRGHGVALAAVDRRDEAVHGGRHGHAPQRKDSGRPGHAYPPRNEGEKGENREGTAGPRQGATRGDGLQPSATSEGGAARSPASGTCW